MKRILICAAAAIVALASCSKTQVVYNDAPEEIGFKAVTGVMTKADVALTAGSMGVFANINATKDTYFENEKFTKQGVNVYWSGVNKQYWPINDALDFAFYAPHDDSDPAKVEWSYDNTTAELTIPVSNATLGSQVDWLYGGELLVNKTKGDQPTNGYPIVFKHLLSKIVINIKAEVDGVIDVTSFKVLGTEQIETATIDYTIPASPSIDWSETSANEIDITLINTETAITAAGTDLTAFYVIPSAQKQFEIKYKVNDGPELTYETTTITGTWISGTAYTYNVTIGLAEIKFDAKETDWNPATPATSVDI